MRTLTLTSPYMRGPDVKAVQSALGVQADSELGPVTAEAIKQWRWRAGFKVWDTPTLPARAQRILFGTQKRSAAEVARAKARAKRPAPAAAIRGDSVGERAASIMEAWADKGYHEIGTSNVVPPLQEIARTHGVSAGLIGMGWPWCAFATSLSNLVAGGEHGKAGLVRWKTNGLYCPQVLADARAGRYGLTVVPKEQARRGDLLLFDWGADGVMDHIGRARGPWNGKTIQTVEGNTSASDSGSQSNGGRMAKRTRYWSQISAVVREAR